MLRHSPLTDAYFCFATNAEKGSRQGEHNSTKTLSVGIIKCPIWLTQFLLFIMNIFYIHSIKLTFVK